MPNSFQLWVAQCQRRCLYDHSPNATYLPDSATYLVSVFSGGTDPIAVPKYLPCEAANAFSPFKPVGAGFGFGLMTPALASGADRAARAKRDARGAMEGRGAQRKAALPQFLRVVPLIFIPIPGPSQGYSRDHALREKRKYVRKPMVRKPSAGFGVYPLE